MRKRGLAGVAAAVVLLTTACGLGSTPTPPPADDTSASGSAGDVSVSAAFISSSGGSGYAAGSTAVAEFKLSDSGTSWDTVTGVSSPSADSARLYQLNSPQKQISVPTGGGYVEASCQLIGLHQSLSAGQMVPLTFQFTGAGSLTVEVPVH